MQTENNSHGANENWETIRGKIKAKFNKLSDDSINSIKGNVDQLASKLQGKEYGYSKEKAESELSAFKVTLDSKSGTSTSSNASNTSKSNETPQQ